MTFKILMDVDNDLALSNGEYFRWLRVDDDIRYAARVYGISEAFEEWHDYARNGGELDGAKEIFSGTYEECMAMYEMQVMLGVAHEWGYEV
ncbi:hypothetical protein VPMG_00036 [Vibrio phage VBP32]|uniref:Uncharacterized protein n=2 Tax=Stoningtonvirus VBP47 TaxID=2846606 RepID=M4SQR3_9CAUD|nr:hypothetical protein VPNG_00092 [Vibrio phage VBP47]YP_007676526.1 hypothetical protein VPMG_00036 [Vibrio phage VBP32]AGH57116.1 hypothetical protein VPNG_00092 [Vibrio phage VBP47]AGH57175.1 hypothetical protein VPMG_00036 [Vibrio phage VBP32]